jgi:hypothetical protein
MAKKAASMPMIPGQPLRVEAIGPILMWVPEAE